MRTLALAALGTFVAAAPANAADPFYLGAWKVSGAVVAPWADPARKPDRTEAARLSGKSVVLKAKEITGPQPFPCKKPIYVLVEYPPEQLFQGAFEELRDKDKSVEPAKLAASLGFAGKTIRTLETGCELDFHFVDEKTAEIGLNDYVYTLKKQ